MSDEKLREREPKAGLNDSDNPEWAEEDFARAKPASAVHGAKVAAALVRGRGRPAKAPEERKRQVTLRVAPEVVEAARGSGKGWQVRAEAALRREFLGGERVITHQLGQAVAKAARATVAERDPSTGRLRRTPTRKAAKRETKKRA